MLQNVNNVSEKTNGEGYFDMNKSPNPPKKKISTINERVRGDKIFYWCCLAWPIFQFLIFYVYVNLDSFVLAFQKYDEVTHTYNFTDPFVNFNRFIAAFQESNVLGRGVLYNLLNYAIGLLLGTPLVIYMSFAIYKKIPGGVVFKILLYAPTIVSSTVWVLLYSHTVENLVPELINKLFGTDMGGLLSRKDTMLVTLLYFQRWYSLGGGTLLYIATMEGVPIEQSEAMRIDGANMGQEFFHLTMPSVWPIISLFLWTGIPSIITSDMGLYTFYSEGAPIEVRSFGYWLTIIKFRAAQNIKDLPYVAAIGMAQSAVVLPLMFLVKKLLSKLGPRTEE
jgi:ABC-type polysaccharide transport system permease subunit